MSGTVYTSWKDALGVSHIDEPVAVYENGRIYTAVDGFLGTTAKGVCVGEYEDGKVYSVGTGTFNYGKRINLVAVIEGGRIYSVSKSIMGGISKSLSVGECSCGKIYSHSHKIMEGSESFGLYNGDEEGAAAAAAISLFKLESNVSAYYDDGSSSSRRRSTSDDDEDLWEKYGLLMPIVVTFRFFKYTFIVGKWIFGAIAWIIAAITRAVRKHKDKKKFKENDILKDSPKTTNDKTDTSPAIITPCEHKETETFEDKKESDTYYEDEEVFADKIEITSNTGAESTSVVTEEKKIEEKVDRMCQEQKCENNHKEKNKWLALFLAVFPYNIFGLYQFYMNGKKKGLLRLCTLNFLYVGYFMDCYEAITNIIKTNKN